MIFNCEYLQSVIGYSGFRSSIKSFIDPQSEKAQIDHDDPDSIKYLTNCKVHVKFEAGDELTKIFNPLLVFPNIHIYVHGSWADHTKTPFSDLDDLIIIEEDKFTEGDFVNLKKALIKVERKFQQLDPLQHHGHWIISGKSLENYDASFIPLFILEDAVRVKGNREIIYKKNEVKTQQGLKKNIITTKSNIERFFKQFEARSINIYTLKEFIGSILLIPPMIFQLKGREMDKREAINNSSELFSQNAMQCIQWASTCRSEWSNVTDTRSYIMFDNLMHLVWHPRYARKIARKLSPDLSSHLYEEWKLNESALASYIAEIESYL